MSPSTIFFPLIVLLGCSGHRTADVSVDAILPGKPEETFDSDTVVFKEDGGMDVAAGDSDSAPPPDGADDGTDLGIDTSPGSGGGGRGSACMGLFATAVERCGLLQFRAPGSDLLRRNCRRAFLGNGFIPGVKAVAAVVRASSETVRATVETHLQQNIDLLRVCYAEGLGARMKKKGSAAVRFTFSENECGANVIFKKSALPDKETRGCVKAVLRVIETTQIGPDEQNGFAEVRLDFGYRGEPKSVDTE